MGRGSLVRDPCVEVPGWGPPTRSPAAPHQGQRSGPGMGAKQNRPLHAHNPHLPAPWVPTPGQSGVPVPQFPHGGSSRSRKPCPVPPRPAPPYLARTAGPESGPHPTTSSVGSPSRPPPRTSSPSAAPGAPPTTGSGSRGPVRQRRGCGRSGGLRAVPQQRPRRPSGNGKIPTHRSARPHRRQPRSGAARPAPAGSRRPLKGERDRSPPAPLLLRWFPVVHLCGRRAQSQGRGRSHPARRLQEAEHGRRRRHRVTAARFCPLHRGGPEPTAPRAPRPRRGTAAPTSPAAPEAPCVGIASGPGALSPRPPPSPNPSSPREIGRVESNRATTRPPPG